MIGCAAGLLAQAAHPGASNGASNGTVVEPGAPGTPSQTLPAKTTGVALAASRADIEFMQGMIMHHQQAVEMTALIPSRTENAAVRALGERISLSQSDEIQWMRQWLTERGQPIEMPMDPKMNMADMPLMPGMLTPAQMDALRKATGAEFDRLFLEGMIQHHGGALTMVKDLFNEAGAGQDADLFQFATDVDNTQRAEIRLMQRMLKEKP
jgi:uncharacterized protein (DUF305 family)